MHEQRLADDFHLLQPLHRLGDEQQVSEQEAVDVHLQGEKLNSAPRVTLTLNLRNQVRAVTPSYPTVLALLHPQRPLQVQLPGLLRGDAPHGRHEVEVAVLLEDLSRDRTKACGQSEERNTGLFFITRRFYICSHPGFLSHLLHLLTAALYSLVGVDAGGGGGELLSLLALPHLRVHAVDEALDRRHLEERNRITHKPQATDEV